MYIATAARNASKIRQKWYVPKKTGTSSNANSHGFNGYTANAECQLTGRDCLISSGTLVRYQECDWPAEVARTPPVFWCSTVLWYWYWLPWTSVSVPPRACSTASGAHVSHFLHPGLAKIYACALPSISRRTCTLQQTQLSIGCTSFSASTCNSISAVDCLEWSIYELSGTQKCSLIQEAFSNFQLLRITQSQSRISVV